MKYTKSAIGLLNARYRSVLKKCLLINLGIFALGAVAATPAMADVDDDETNIMIFPEKSTGEIRFYSADDDGDPENLIARIDRHGNIFVREVVATNGLQSGAGDDFFWVDSANHKVNMGANTKASFQEVLEIPSISVIGSHTTPWADGTPLAGKTIGKNDTSTDITIVGGLDLLNTATKNNTDAIKDNADAIKDLTTNPLTGAINVLSAKVAGANVLTEDSDITAKAVFATTGEGDDKLTTSIDVNGATFVKGDDGGDEDEDDPVVVFGVDTASETVTATGTISLNGTVNVNGSSVLTGDSTIDVAKIDTTNYANSAVETAVKTSISAAAGKGLTYDTTSNTLNVNVDDSTLEINSSNGLQIKDNGVTFAKINSSAYDTAGISAGGAGSAEQLATTQSVVKTITNNAQLATFTDSTTAHASINGATTIQTAIQNVADAVDTLQGVVGDVQDTEATAGLLEGETIGDSITLVDAIDAIAKSAAGLAEDNTFTGSNTFAEAIIAEEGIVFGTSGFGIDGDGVATLSSLDVDGEISGATLDIAGGKFTVNENGGFKAANGNFKVNKHGGVTAAGGDFKIDKDGNTTIGGDLGVVGDTTLAYTLIDDNLDVTGDVSVDGTTILSATNGLQFGASGQNVTSIDAGSSALATKDATQLATVATVLTSAENADYTATSTTGNITADGTLKSAINELDEAIGNRDYTGGSIDYTNDSGTVTEAIQTVNANIGAAVSGEKGNVAATNSVNQNLDSIDVAIGDRIVKNDAGADYSASTSPVVVTDALTKLASNIGSATTAANGNIVSTYTVNQNLDKIDTNIGDISTFANSTTGNLSNSSTPSTTTNAADVATAINNIDATLGKIHGLYDAKTHTVNSTVVTSTVNGNSNLASGTTVEDHLVTLDNSVGDRTLVSANADINTQMSGTSVAAGLKAAGDAIGDMNFAGTKYISQSQDLSSAVRSLDSNLARIDNDVRDLKHDFRSGMASMAAMTALAPNARGCGDTSLSFGTGAYDGHTAMAFGAFHYLSDNVLLNAGVAWGNTKDAAYRMGVTWSF